ncbi:hypothetical protein [Variovorax sp. JS1663]|uniref:hypothetical protein n=1 Tax=Variovorax sp. JS1663 TaxID=1851577 RepID=UPI000B34A0BF|nr:hypothetical protein [Variovorax sp. JS1663]OUM01750.1 hypothetical protein A8M77_14405 [Variovorax sp. JS1663]
MDKLLGFAPDVDPVTPGIFTDCSNIIPLETSFVGAPTGAAANAPALAAACRGAVIVTKLDETRRIFAGTQTKLYELLGTVWTDRSAGGGSYTGSVDSRWSFCQFGDTSIASNLVDNMQSSTTGAFAALAGAPKAKIVVSASNNFVIAFNTNEGTFGVAPDRWWCCAQSDQTNWTPSVATGATTGRLVAAPGGIQAGLQLGDYVIAYKTRGVFLGQFVGSQSGTWGWSLVPGSNDCGAVGQEAVCDIGGAHFIVGDDDFWIFDGTRPVSIGDEVRNWFRRNSSQTYRFRARATFDRQRQCVWVAFASQGSTGALDRMLVWNLKSKRWGIADRVSEAALTFTAPGVTIDGLNAYSSTIDGLPAVPFDSQYWLSGGRAFAYFDANHQLVVANGVCGASSFTTGDYGDDGLVTLLERVHIRFSQRPTSAAAAGFFKFEEGATLQAGPTEQMYDGGFDVWQSGRFHRLRFDFMGDHRETAIKVPLRPDGMR